MAQALIRKLNDETLADFRAAAKEKGRSLEAELRDLIERNRPKRRKSREELLALADALASNSKMGSDSTPYIRWLRDTNGGKWDGSDYRESDAGD
jgi:plasmid stability protein